MPLVQLAALDELAQLAQYLYCRLEQTLRRKLFWHRIYTRFDDIASLFGVSGNLESFSGFSEQQLFFAKVQVRKEVERFMQSVDGLFSEILVSGEVQYNIAAVQDAPGEKTNDNSWASSIDLRWSVPPPLLSDCPEFLYFQPDCKVARFQSEQVQFWQTREFISQFSKSAICGELCILECNQFYFILKKETVGHSLTALSTLRYPIAAATLSNGVAKTSRSIDEELRLQRKARWAENGANCAIAAKQIERFPFPCVYVEDEQKTCADMLYLWRLWLYLELPD